MALDTVAGLEKAYLKDSTLHFPKASHAGIMVAIMVRRWEYEIRALDGNTGPCHLITVDSFGGVS